MTGLRLLAFALSIVGCTIGVTLLILLPLAWDCV